MENVSGNIIQVLQNEYGLEVMELEKGTVGAGSDTWFVTCKDDRYVMKYPCESEINHPKQEPQLCEYLIKCGIPACQFLKNMQGEYLSKDNQGRVFHVQRFIEGRMYEWNTVPRWLLMESAAMLGRIHTVLKNYRGLPIGIGEDFFRYMTPENAMRSYENSLQIAVEQKAEDVIEDLQYRIKLMKRFPVFEFDIRRLTCQSTHGDYFISQLLCGENEINAVIDWTTACVHPVVWELVRSYVYAAPSCKDGEIAIEEFVQYVGEYCKYAELTDYDIANMAAVFYYQIAVCDYYGQYYGTNADNRYIYLQQARLSTKLLKWFEKNGEELKICLHQYLKKQSLQVIGKR